MRPIMREEVEDVESAVDLAKRFKAEGRYNWFRGQVRELPPHPSLLRIQMRHDKEMFEAAKRRLRMFHEWALQIEYLAPLLEEENLPKLFAILQHYGVPTHYLDFTTAPEIAGFFACDTKRPPTDELSCIYCLNTTDLVRLWDSIRQLPGREGAVVQPVVIDVSNLWRLQAQAGVFLDVNTDWDTIYPMDRIVFPYKGYPAKPTKDLIYPELRSALEQLLDHYFAYERGQETSEDILKFIAELRAKGRSAVAVRIQTWDRGVYSPAFIDAGARLENLPSWDDPAMAPWRAIPDERFHETVGRKHRFTVPENKLAIDVGEALRSQVTQSLAPLRSQALRFSFDRQLPEEMHELPIMLERAWNGMRMLPYLVEEIAECLGRVATLFALGFADMLTVEERRECMGKHFGVSQQTAFGTADGASSMAWATKAALTAALRSDIGALLTPEHASRAEDISELFRVIYNPRIMFEFGPFKRTFARELIPSQVLDRRQFILFNPTLVATFGNP